MTAQIMHDTLIKLITCRTDGGRISHTAQRQNADFRCAAADVHHHRTGSILNRQACTQSSRHRLLNQMYGRCTCGKRRIQNCLAFHLSCPARHADHNARRYDRITLCCLFNQHAQHTLGNRKISNHPVPHRTDDFNIARCAPLHFLGFRTDGNNLTFTACTRLDRHHRRFVQNNAFTTHINQRVRRTQVNGDIV